MTEQELIQKTVEETIRQLRISGLLRSVSDLEYREASAELKKYYADGENRQDIKSALADLSDDKYIKILPMYYGYGYTIEEIAESYEVEVSTISRNKKRLSLEVYSRLRR